MNTVSNYKEILNFSCVKREKRICEKQPPVNICPEIQISNILPAQPASHYSVGNGNTDTDTSTQIQIHRYRYKYSCKYCVCELHNFCLTYIQTNKHQYKQTNRAAKNCVATPPARIFFGRLPPSM